MKKLTVLLTVIFFAMIMVSISLTGENCVSAECNRKCGTTGHETWCSSYQKVKNDLKIDLYAQTIDPKDLKKSDPKDPVLQKSPPPPLEEPKKEPTPLDNLKRKIQERMKPLDPPQPPGGYPPRG